MNRRKKLAGGKRGEEEDYHSDDDLEGKQRRQARRKKHGEKIHKGGRNDNSDSDYSYRSVVSRPQLFVKIVKVNVRKLGK